MSPQFTGLRAKRYTFKDSGGNRPVIALYAGEKPLGFIEYEVARRFVDRIHDLCDERDRELREAPHE